MSKLREIIHQYVVEALQEILSEEHNPELDKLVDKYSYHIVNSRDSQYPEADEQEAGDILRKIKKNHGEEAVRYARAHAQRNLDDVNRQENEKSKAELKANYKPTSGPAVKQYKESVNQISEARKLLKTYNSSIAGIGAKVYHNPETGEHQVDFYKNGKNLGEGPRYYTDDREDAHDTAQAEIKHMEKIETALQKMRDNLAKRAPQTDKYDD